MTPEERVESINSKIWFWFPVRWTNGVDWWEIKSVTVVGNEESGGVDIIVKKNETEPVLIHFTNNELYGDSSISLEVARTRVMV